MLFEKRVYPSSFHFLGRYFVIIWSLCLRFSRLFESKEKGRFFLQVPYLTFYYAYPKCMFVCVYICCTQKSANRHKICFWKVSLVFQNWGTFKVKAKIRLVLCIIWGRVCFFFWNLYQLEIIYPLLKTLALLQEEVLEVVNLVHCSQF